MQFPHYIYYEILIRVEEYVPNVGDFISVVELEHECLIHTTTGNLTINHDILYKQFKDPSLVKREDIAALFRNFTTL